MPEELKENIQIYEDVIKDLCQFYEHIEISDNIVKLYEYFRYMYTKGYLSSDEYQEKYPESFVNIESKIYVPMDVCGFFVMAGAGVCRHTTDFLEHIYDGLHYISSRLFLYNPDTKIDIINRTGEFLTNYHAQKLIDELIKEIDLYGDERQNVSRDFAGVEIVIEYFPSKIKPNHVVNVVKSKDKEIVHILDTRLHSVGEIIDERKIILNNLGFTSVADVDQHPFTKFSRYYDTDYDIGPMLINNFDTNVKQDINSSILYRDSAPKFEEEYKRFKARNQERFDIVANNIQLVKRYLR